MPEERWIGGRKPDIAVIHDDRVQRSGLRTSTMVAPMEVIIPAYVDQIKSSFITIRTRDRKQVVTVIELLSPSNKKPGVDRDAYIGKRKELLASWTNLVEIDLHRAWPRMPWEGTPECDYAVAVCRHWRRPTVDFWPLTLTDPLPTIPIPLKEGDREVTLDLQAVVNQVYDDAGYENYLYGDAEPNPAFTDEQNAWAESLITGNPVPV